jgi:hypothetical protein
VFVLAEENWFWQPDCSFLGSIAKYHCKLLHTKHLFLLDTDAQIWRNSIPALSETNSNDGRIGNHLMRRFLNEPMYQKEGTVHKNFQLTEMWQTWNTSEQPQTWRFVEIGISHAKIEPQDVNLGIGTNSFLELKFLLGLSNVYEPWAAF